MICSYCEQEMTGGTQDCTGNVVRFPDGEVMEAVPYYGSDSCHDCSVKSGGRHLQVATWNAVHAAKGS